MIWQTNDLKLQTQYVFVVIDDDLRLFKNETRTQTAKHYRHFQLLIFERRCPKFNCLFNDAIKQFVW